MGGQLAHGDELSKSRRYRTDRSQDMRFAISIPQFVSDGQFDPARFRAYMARAEAFGFESAWTLEQTLGTMPFMSPLQTMSYAAACTNTLGLRRVRHTAAQPGSPRQGP